MKKLVYTALAAAAAAAAAAALKKFRDRTTDDSQTAGA